VQYYSTVPRFRRPNVSVEDFYRYGVGNMGVFLSRSKVTGEYDSVALLSEPTTDKNLFYISSFAWAIDVFRKRVHPDFTIQDGICLCASLTCIPNGEIIVAALVSGELQRVWGNRHLTPAGPLGLLFEIGRKRNGGVSNVGPGCTRRSQPWTGRTLPCERYKKLVECTMNLCYRSKRARKGNECSQAQYEKLLLELQTSMGGRVDQPLLCLQHFLHLVEMLGYLCQPGVHRLAAINPTNSNAEFIEQMLGQAEETKQERLKKLQQMQTQTEIYMSSIFQTDFASGKGENATCESIRRLKEEEFKRFKKEGGKRRSSPIPATDMYFPGQTYFEHRKCSITNEYSLSEVAIQWNETSQDFQSIYVSNFGKFGPHSTVSNSNNQPPLNGNGILDCVGDKGTHEVVFVKRQNIDGALFLQIKKLMAAAYPVTSVDQIRSTANSIGQLLETNPEHQRCGRAAKRAEWEVRADAWNSSIEPKLQEALLYHNIEPMSIAKPVILNKRKKKTPKKSDNSQYSKINHKEFNKESLCITPVQSTKQASMVTPDTDYGSDWDDLSFLFQEDELSVDSVLQDRKKRKLMQQPGTGNSLRDVFQSISKAALVMRGSRKQTRKVTANAAMVDLSKEDDSEFHSDSDTSTMEEIEGGNGGSPLLQLPQNTPPQPKVPPTKQQPRCHSKNDVQNKLPLLNEVDGIDRTLDWSKDNLRRCLSQTTRINNIAIYSYNNPLKLSFVFDNRFRNFIGSKSLFEQKQKPIFKCPNLLDEARTCLNTCLSESGLPPIPSDFGKRDIVYGEHINGASKLFTCHLPRILGDFTFHTCDRCLLCDHVAELLLGERTAQGLGEVWAFESKVMASKYFLLCLFLSTGTSSYFLNLQRRAKKKYHAIVASAKEVGSKPKQAEELDAGDYFLLSFGCPEYTEMPYFYLIGNHHHKRFDHHHQIPIVMHDFAVAVGDLGHFRRMSSQEGKRKLGKESGRAMYFRPIREHG
jgi:hypothetical protein